VEELLTAWGHLELVNAITLDDERSNLTEEEEETVEEGILTLRLMLTEY